ncbi:MAG: hypothetical protein ACI363_01255 [Phocaeicola plebeius]
MNEIIESKQILKDLHLVLAYAKQRFLKEFNMQEIRLNDTFKVAFRSFLVSKDYSVQYFEHTTVVTNKVGQHIYIANQWFVIASYFVDFCLEMQSYKALFEKICRRMSMKNEEMKEYATRLKHTPTKEDESLFLSVAIDVLKENFPGIDENYDKVASYLWKFASDYSWWAGNKTIDRHDFYISSLLNQMNTVNANSEFLAIITLAYSSVLKLRILIEDIDNFTIGAQKNVQTEIEPDIPKEADYDFEYNGHKMSIPTKGKGISISAASLKRFQTMG